MTAGFHLRGGGDGGIRPLAIANMQTTITLYVAPKDFQIHVSPTLPPPLDEFSK